MVELPVRERGGEGGGVAALEEVNLVTILRLFMTLHIPLLLRNVVGENERLGDGISWTREAAACVTEFRGVRCRRDV